MRTHRNADGRVEAPGYSEWASYELGMAIMAVVIGRTIQEVQHHLHYNDWQMREVVRKWAEEKSHGPE